MSKTNPYSDIKFTSIY